MRIDWRVWPLSYQLPPGRREPFPLIRTKDMRYHPYFLGPLTRGIWRLFAYRFTKPGLWALLVTVLIGAYGSNSLQMQGYVPFVYLAALWMIDIIGVWFYRPRVILQVQHPDRIGVGDTLLMECIVESRRHLNPPELNLLPNMLPPNLDSHPIEGVIVPGIGFKKRIKIELGLYCTKRGVYEWPGFRVESEFPLGLVRSLQTFRQHQQILVYPNFNPLTTLTLTAGRRYQPGGVSLASKVGESFEYMGNRPYRGGDDIRHIDWRATARLNAPVVREYREEYLMRVAVILDAYIPDDADPGEWDSFENAVSLCAAVTDYMTRSDYLVDLFAAGSTLYHLLAGRNLANLDQVLDILACVQTSSEASFEILEPELMMHLEQITTVICLFLDWDETRQLFVSRLLEEGTGVRVIVVRDSPCTSDPRYADMPGSMTLINAAQFAAGIAEL